MVICRSLLIYETGWHCYHSTRGWYDITYKGVKVFEVVEVDRRSMLPSWTSNRVRLKGGNRHSDGSILGYNLPGVFMHLSCQY